MRVLYVSTEVHPALKTGGLADVNAALPAALARAGADVRLLLPGFPALLQAATARRPALPIGAGPGGVALAVVPCMLGEVKAWLIDAPLLFARTGNPYVDARGQDWPDNALRFAALGFAAARFADGSVEGWRPDVVHSHDWHAALCSAYLRARGGDGPASVFTVHNLGYQGQFDAAQFPALGLPAHFFAMHGVEFHGALNFMKAGLFYADRITTVSPTYAQEIQTASHGFGMEGLLRSRAGALTGILNGVDTAVWNPATDPHLAARYQAGDLRGKAQGKAALRVELGLASDRPGPLVAVVSRLTPQKGLDLLLDALPVLLQGGAQVAMLGAGDAELEARWLAAARAHPGIVAVHSGYNEALAHRIIAGADMIAVPSRFEPCGLTQMYGMRYGTPPLVRATGGLKDTVHDATPVSLHDGSATGFVFDAPSVAATAGAVQRALDLWRQPRDWARLVANAMGRDFGWDTAAQAYMRLYRELRPHG
jgi:starch synthase